MEAFFGQTRINSITLVLGHFYHNAENGPIANAAQLFKFHAPILPTVGALNYCTSRMNKVFSVLFYIDFNVSFALI
jgi:hypothetical protein